MFHLTSSSRAERVAQQHFDMQRAVLKIGETITARQERYNNFKKTLTAETLKNVCVRKQIQRLREDVLRQELVLRLNKLVFNEKLGAYITRKHAEIIADLKQHREQVLKKEFMKKALVTALENAFKTKAEEKEKKRFLAHCLSIELKNFLELRGKKLLNTRNSDELNRSTEDWIEEPHTLAKYDSKDPLDEIAQQQSHIESLQVELKDRNLSLDKLQIENERILKQNEQLINELGDEKECNFSLKENINVQTKELESKNDLIAFYVLDHLKKEKEITRLEQNVMDTNFELAQFERRDNACLQPPIFIRKSDRAHLPKLYESAQIGKGAFGKVYRIEMKVDGILGTYAVKVQDKAQLEGLVKCHDILSSENDIYMVLDLYSMTLEAAQEEDETTINSIEAYIDFVTQINASLMALHKLKIAHRDIKAANILTKRNTDGSNVYVLADFGSCLLFCNKNCTKDCHPDEGYTHKYTELDDNLLQSGPIDGSCDMFGAAILFMDVLCEMYSISNSELFDSRMDLAGNEQIVPKSNIAEIAEELLEQIPDNRFKVVISEIILGLLHKDRKIRLTVYQVEKILKIYAIRSKPLLLIQKNEECPSSISLDSSFEERIKFIHGFAEYIDTLHTNNLLQMSTDGFGCEELSQTGFECEESGYRNETPKPTIINISRPTRLNLSCSESCKAIECFKFDIKSKDNVFEYLSMKTIKRINSDDGFHSSKALDCYAFGILMLKVFFPAFSVLSINCKSLVQDLNKRDMSGMIVKDGIDISKDLIEIIASLLNGTEEIQKVVEFFDEMKGTGDIQKEGQDEVDDEATQYSGDETD